MTDFTSTHNVFDDDFTPEHCLVCRCDGLAELQSFPCGTPIEVLKKHREDLQKYFLDDLKNLIAPKDIIKILEKCLPSTLTLMDLGYNGYAREILKFLNAAGYEIVKKGGMK